jgi:hypothetical protein
MGWWAQSLGLPYRSGVNYSFDTFNQQLHTPAYRGFAAGSDLKITNSASIGCHITVVMSIGNASNKSPMLWKGIGGRKSESTGTAIAVLEL